MYMLIGSIDQEDLESNFLVDGDRCIGFNFQGNVIGLLSQGGNRISLEIRDICDEYCYYLFINGYVFLQWDKIS